MLGSAYLSRLRTFWSRPPSILRGYLRLLAFLSLTAAVLTQVFPWWSDYPSYVKFLIAGLCLGLALFTPRVFVIPAAIAVWLGGSRLIIKIIEKKEQVNGILDIAFLFVFLVTGLYAFIIQFESRKKPRIPQPSPLMPQPAATLPRMPAAAVIFDRMYPYEDEARVIHDLYLKMRLFVPQGRTYSTIQPGIMSSNRDMLPDICEIAFTPLLGDGYQEALLQVTPFEMEDHTGGVVVYHP